MSWRRRTRSPAKWRARSRPRPGGSSIAADSTRFDGQSAIAIYQMAILGMGQIIREHPERRDEYLPAMRAAAARMTDPRTLPTATRAWGHNGLVTMAPGEGHAYLGYMNLALGMLRAVDPATPHAALHDRLTAALADRLDRSPTGLIETYPGETWPPDVAAVAGSIGLHAAVTGVDRRALLERWSKRFEACALHRSGYLVQRVRSGGCKPVDAPRGSGTAIASYFLSFADTRLSRRLLEGLRREGRACALGFCGIREYAPGFHGKGDVDAGPMLMGMSVGRVRVRAGRGPRARRRRSLPRAVSQRAPGGRARRGRRHHEVRGGRHARQRAAARDADREPRPRRGHGGGGSPGAGR